MAPRRQPSTRTATATTVQKTTTTRASRSKPTATTDTPDELASTLATKLALADVKGKQRAPAAGRTTAPRTSRIPSTSKSKIPTASDLATQLATKLTLREEDEPPSTPVKKRSKEETCADAMRSVNAVSKGLSAIINSGWKWPSTASPATPTIPQPPPAPRKPTAKSRSVHPAEAKPKSTQDDSLALASKGRAELQILRELRQGDIDIERAASSLAEKLIALGMYKSVLDVLRDMRPHLASLSLSPSDAESISDDPLIYLVHFPLPPSQPNPNTLPDILLSLISTYFLHALTAVSYTIFTSPSITPTTLSDFEQALHSGPGLLEWLPRLSSVLPTKHIDNILTRAYTVLTKPSAPAPPPTPSSPSQPSILKSTFLIRTHSLLYLAYTSPGVLQPDTFWTQAVKFGVAYVKDVASSPSSSSAQKDDAARSIVAAYARLILHAQRRRDALEGFMDGRGFLGFCEYWMGFAKKINDLNELERIGELVQRSSSRITSFQPSSSSSTRASSQTIPREPSRDRDTPGISVSRSPPHPQTSETQRDDVDMGGMADAARICATFTQATALLEHFHEVDGSATTAAADGNMDDDHERSVRKCLRQAVEVVGRCAPFVCRACEADTVERAGQDKEEERERGEQRKCAEKVRRALERLRRACVKVLDPSSSKSTKPPGPCSSELKRQMKTLIEKCVDVLEYAIHKTGEIDLYTPSLDSLFTLARASLRISDSTTYNDAFSYLARAASLIPDSAHHLQHANFLRCISGAFHNIAGTLYQGSRYDFAVRFLEESCALGGRALQMYRKSLDVRGAKGEEEEEKKTWVQLEDQLCRRWEILGVCHSKTGDRKAAFDAFVGCIRTFPFHRPAFLALVSAHGPTAFSPTSPEPQLKHIAGIVDRMTYVGVCDLLLDPHSVSLKTCLPGPFVGSEGENGGTSSSAARRMMGGALLERQMESLDGSRWKPDVRRAVRVWLHDALEMYDAASMPVCRARVLLRRLEMAYHAEPEDHEGSMPCLEEIGQEVEVLLTGQDTTLDSTAASSSSPPPSQSPRYYLAMLKLRLALLVHRSAQTSHFSRVVAYAEEACAILKSTLAVAPPRQSLPVLVSPPGRTAAAAAAGKKVGVKTVGRRGATRARSVKTAAATATATATVPATPRRKTSKTASNAPVATVNRRQSSVSQASPAFDDLPKLVDLLRTTVHLLGLLGQVLTKVHLLIVARRICERTLNSRPDDYVKFSVDLAHEYVKLGKTEKGGSIYNHIFSMLKTLDVSDETRVLFSLRYAESLASTGNVLKSSTAYCEATSLSEALPVAEKGASTAQRVTARVSSLERAAAAANAFASIQYSRDDPTTSINGLLRSLRLWHRALDTLSRLVPPAPEAKATEESPNPFLTSEPADLVHKSSAPDSQTTPAPPSRRLPSLDGLEWRIAEGLLGALFSLTQAYLARGSPREAEYFAQQAKDLAASLNAPAMVSRALARIGEIQLHQGLLEESHASLVAAAELVVDTSGPDAAEIQRLRAEYSRRNSDGQGAQQMYEEAITMLEELETLFGTLDGGNVGPRKSLGVSPKSTKTQLTQDILAPGLLVAILRQNIWLLHGEGEEYQSLLDRLRSLPNTAETKAEESALMARLTLDDVYARFQADMFLSSLAETTLTLPMGMAKEKPTTSASSQEILAILDDAEKLFWSDLALVARRGNVFHFRDAAISLALIRAFQTSLGKIGTSGPTLAARLLDSSTAITLRREILEVVEHKFPDILAHDDSQWPLITTNGLPLPPQKSQKQLRFAFVDSEEEADDTIEELSIKKYWEFVANKYRNSAYDAAHLSESQADALPPHWTVISISITEDKNTMFITRQRPHQEPLIFCIPLKERRESNEDEPHLTFDGAITELKDIIRLSDEGTRQAINVRNDREARAAWWADRSALDTRMKDLLENIEFCWLGAFKSILSEPKRIPADLLSAFRTRLEKVFKRNIILHDKQKTSVRLGDALLECFASLSPKCRDEELEDVVYFILDLYQLHGIPVAISEVDIDQVVVDFRAVLEEHAAKSKGKLISEQDPHLFLVLDKNVQGIPWESIPILRGRSISRIPSMDFLLDRLDYARWQKSPKADIQTGPQTSVDRAVINPRNVFVVLNPSGDLKNTEGRFVNWLKEMKCVGWESVVGRAPSEQQFANALTQKDLVIYFGHGGAEQYIRSHKVRHLPQCAATMLWGCSSGALRDMGDFDRTGTPYNYMLAGCPTLVANLWDVTDRDIDKFSQAVFDRMRLNVDDVRSWRHTDATIDGNTSIVAAVAQSRDCCKLKYLTGAAPVVYGIPFYL